MLPDPFTPEELQATVGALLEEGGLFATAPMTIRGVEYPHVFQISAGASLRDLMAMKGMEHAANEFIVYGEERYTIGETWSRSMRFANWLVSTQDVKPGDRVGIAMRNYPEWVMAFIGIVASGATVVPLNAWWQTEELCEGVERCGAKIVVCDDKRNHQLLGAKERLGLTLVGARGDIPDTDFSLGAILQDDALGTDAPPVKIDPGSDFCLLYTSGSTGKPKGALLTHQSVVNAVISWSFLLNAAQRMRPDYPFTPENPAVLMALPLFHVTALHSTLILSWMLGRKTVFMHKWDPVKAIEHIKDEQITNFVGVPTMAHELVDRADPDDLSTLKDIITGGAKRPSSQVMEQFDKLPEVGLSAGYGLTETNSLVAHISMSDFISRPDSAGRPIPPVNQIAAFSETGGQLAQGEEGELCVKSPVTFRGYDDDEAATDKAFFPGGWFRTGDIGYLDAEGFLYIVDRAKDLIIRGGENISCPEVENALVSFEGVDEAAAFSVPDERFGEIVGAAVYGRGGAIDLQALRDHAATQLAAFKVPERLWLSPQSLPRGGTGKVDKRQTKMIGMSVPAHWSAS